MQQQRFSACSNWWHTSSESEDTEGNSTCANNYNPTACLTGFIIRFADIGSDLYTIGCRIADEAFDSYVGHDLLNDMHTLLCYIRLLQYCEEAGRSNIIDLSILKEKLLLQVKSCITQNIAEWDTSYICKPSQFFNTRNSIFYADNREIAEFECEFITKTQLDDGSWNIPWSWDAYLKEWAVAENWWKSAGIISNMLYLRGMQKPEKIRAL